MFPSTWTKSSLEGLILKKKPLFFQIENGKKRNLTLCPIHVNQKLSFFFFRLIEIEKEKLHFSQKKKKKLLKMNHWYLEDKSPELEENQISILQMNALADEFCLGNKREGVMKEFDKYDDKILEWSFRVKTHLAIIERNNSDFVCLQEVDAVHCENLDKEMVKFGYKSYFHQDRKKNKFIGNVTFYKEDKYECIHKESRSRIIIMLFKAKKFSSDQKEFLIAIANCHLEAGHKQAEKRFQQIKSCFAELTKIKEKYAKKKEKETIFSVFVVGDLNTGIESGKKKKTTPRKKNLKKKKNEKTGVYKLLLEGKLEANFKDVNGISCCSQDYDSPFTFKSAYKENFGSEPPFTIIHGQLLDFIFYDHSNFQVESSLKFYENKQDKSSTRKLALTETISSDHFPLCSVFRLK